MVTKDFVSDENPAIFLYLSERNGIPEYVYDSARITSAETEGLNKVAFADPLNRLFPCHTKAACWNSAAYYAANGGGEGEVKESILKMAGTHGIREDVEKVFSLFEEAMAKKASAEPERKYALNLDFGGFQGRGVENFYPINTESEIFSSAEDAAKAYRAGSIPMPAMRKIAMQIVAAADEMEYPIGELPADVKHLGVRRLPNPSYAETLLMTRKDASCDTAPYEDAIGTLKVAFSNPAIDKELLMQVAEDAAEKIYRLDKEAGVSYDKRTMPDPYDLIFSGPTVADMHKAAASLVAIRDVTVPVADLINLKEETIDKHFSAASARLIKEARAAVAAEANEETCAIAHQKIASLKQGVQKTLLAVLANVGW